MPRLLHGVSSLQWQWHQDLALGRQGVHQFISLCSVLLHSILCLQGIQGEAAALKPKAAVQGEAPKSITSLKADLKKQVPAVINPAGSFCIQSCLFVYCHSNQQPHETATLSMCWQSQRQSTTGFHSQQSPCRQDHRLFLEL